MKKEAIQAQGYKLERIFRNEKQAKRYVFLRNSKTEIFVINGRFEVWKTPKQNKVIPVFSEGLKGNFERKDFCKKNRIPFTKSDNETLDTSIKNWANNTVIP